MIVKGSQTIPDAAPERVFDALGDPVLLARALPGCRELVDRGDGVYDLAVEAGVGSIRGAYAGQVRIGQQRRPDLYEATLSAGGGPGSVEATLRAQLRPEASGTQVDYELDARLAGPVAGVGQRVIAGVSKRNAESFFDALRRELATNGGGGEAPAVAGEPVAAVAGAPPAGRTHAGTAASPTELRWFLRGLLVGSLLTALGALVARVGRRA